MLQTKVVVERSDTSRECRDILHNFCNSYTYIYLNYLHYIMSTSGTAAPTGLFSNSRGLGFNRSVKYQAGNANSCNEINHKVTWPGYEATSHHRPFHQFSCPPDREILLYTINVVSASFRTARHLPIFSSMISPVVKRYQDSVIRIS